MSALPVILICDHRGRGLAERLRALRTGGVELEVSTHLRSTREFLERRRPELIVVDPLVGAGRVELAEIDRLRGEAPRVPVLLVTDRETPLQAATLGGTFSDDAWDLVHRDATLEEFDLRMSRLRDHVERLEELDELRYIAVHDDRTDLLRPRAFQDRLREHFSAAQRHGFELALILVDLDDFGRINKAHDHTVGDLVIERVGAAIRSSLRAEDIAGRLGGDEFAILLPYTSRRDAAHAAARIRSSIGELGALFAERGIDVRVTASLGFETFAGGDLATVDELRLHAEAALREAKARGGDFGVYYRSLAIGS